MKQIDTSQSKSSQATAAKRPEPPSPVKPTSAGGQLKQSLRGKGLGDQEAALAPPASWSPGAQQGGQAQGAEKKAGVAGPGSQAGAEAKGPAQRGTDKLAPVQPGPHAAMPGGAGKWHLFLEGVDALFQQGFAIEGEATSEHSPGTLPPAGKPVNVEAKGPWGIRATHQAPSKLDWAPGREQGRHVSTHKVVAQGADFFDIGVEDFKDQDFNDLVVSAIRVPGPDTTSDESYLVSSETRVEGATVTYDLILGASSSGQLDVVLNAAMLSPAELGGLDAQTLEALQQRFASFEGQVASSKEHADKRARLLAEIKAWRAAVQQALAKVEQGSAPKAPAAPPARTPEASPAKGAKAQSAT